jgi:hypothetical protein
LGTVIWSNAFLATKTQNAFGVAVDATGNIFVTGSTDGPVDFGGGPTPASFNNNVFVASYGPDGTYRWSKLYVSSGAQFGRAITTAPNGDVVIIGDTDGYVDLGGGVITNGGNLDIFVARYSGTDGSYVWGKLFGKGFDQVVRGINIAADGNVLITGGFEGTVDWGGGQMMTSVGASDVYVAKLDAMTGDHLMHTQGGTLGTSIGTSLGSDAAGNVTVLGHFNGNIDFGGQSATASPNTFDTFLVKLRANDWKPVWTKPFGKAGNQFGWGVAVANDGSALVGGGFYTELEIPPMAILPSTGGFDLFAVRVNP